MKDIHVWEYLDEYYLEKKQIFNAIQEVLESGTLIFGDKLKKFEQDFSKYCDCKYGIGLGTGTDALVLSMRALGIGFGDEVITVSNTAIPTVSAIIQTGATPVFVDVGEDYLMDITKIEDLITYKTKAILPVHLFGQCVEMDSLLKIAGQYELKVIEDCAQSHGATYKGSKAGSFGDAAAFSFYPTKILGTYGDGGMVTTNISKVYEKINSLRFYGIESYGKPKVTRRYYAEEHGYNSRLDEIHASILLTKLSHLEFYIENRRRIAKVYDEELKNTSLILPSENMNNKHAYYVYAVRHLNRTKILKKLKNRGIHLNISYPYPIHLMNGYSYLGWKEHELPNTEKYAKEIFSLPMYPTLSQHKLKYIICTIKEVLDD